MNFFSLQIPLVVLNFQEFGQSKTKIINKGFIVYQEMTELQFSPMHFVVIDLQEV